MAGTPPSPPPLEQPAGATHALVWKHVGFHLDPTATPAKTSERVDLTSIADDGKPRPAPHAPFVADLGAGVACVLPIAVWADAGGTLPRASGQAPAPDKPAAFYPSGDDRATRLAAIVAAWTVPQHFFPYFDVVAVDWDAVLRDSLTRAAEDRDRHAFSRTVKLLAAALQDGHAYTRTPRNPALAADLPLLLVPTEDAIAVAVTDARAPGVRAGDVVLTIDGAATAERMTTLMAETPGAHDDARRVRAVSELGFGPEGSTAELKLRRPDGEEYTASIPRIVDDPPTRPRRPPIDDIKPGIVYVDVERAGTLEVYGAQARFAAARGIVIDSRFGMSDGGLITAITNMLTRNTGPLDTLHTPVSLFPDRRHVRWEDHPWTMPMATGTVTAPVVVLVDPYIISAPEMLLMLLEHHERVTFVGVRSGGTEGEMNTWQLPGGYRLAITSDRVTKHGGARHHGVGVGVDVQVRPTPAGLAAGRDEVLERGVEVLERKLAGG